MNDEKPAALSPLTLLHEHAIRDSFETFQDQMGKAMLFPRKAGLRKYALKQALELAGSKCLFAEFGVWHGHGVNLFARKLKKHGAQIAGFDSFEGLEEDWTGHSKGGEAGRFNLDGELPEVEANVALVKGWVQDTLPGWLAERPDQPMIFAHLDMDTYTPTAFVLTAIRDRLVPGSVLLFDELYGYPGWRHHEYRALQEHLPEGSFDYIGFSEQSVAIQMLRAVT